MYGYEIFYIYYEFYCFWVSSLGFWVGLLWLNIENVFNFGFLFVFL